MGLREDVQSIVRNMAADVKNISSSVNALRLLYVYQEKLREALRKDAVEPKETNDDGN